MNSHGESSKGRNSSGRQDQTPAHAGGGHSKKRRYVLPILLIVMGFAVVAFAAWSAVTSPVLASIINSSPVSAPQQQAPQQSFAQVYIPKPTYTPQSFGQDVASLPPTATLVPPTPEELAAVIPPTDVPAVDWNIVPTTAPDAVAQADVVLFAPTSVVSAEIVTDTTASDNVVPTTSAPPISSIGGSGERWIDVDLTQQRLYAYEGDTVVASFLVSTGTWQTPTVTGKFKIWIKIRSQAMSGPGYYLPNVPYVMYFYKDYGLHGTYWHNNFGTPMSHGCVNLSIPDAEWLYNFASEGTVVTVHY